MYISLPTTHLKYSGVCFMDSTPRHVWVEKGGDSKILESLRRDLLTYKKTPKERATFTNPKHILKGLFFCIWFSSVFLVPDNAITLCVDVLIFYTDDDFVAEGFLLQNGESSSFVLHYSSRFACAIGIRPILLCPIGRGKNPLEKVSERAYKERSTKEHHTQNP